LNKKGQEIFGGIMVIFIVFIVLVILIEPLKQVIIIGRDAQHLDCDNASISVGQSGACILTDWYMFYFLGAVMAASFYYIGRKFLTGDVRQGGG